MDRRNFIKTTGASIAGVLLYKPIFAYHEIGQNSILKLPDEVSANVNGKMVKLSGVDKDIVGNVDMTVFLKNTISGISVSIEAPGASLSSITLKWNIPIVNTTNVLNDDWERAYGDLSWHQPRQSEILPWYFLEYNNAGITGFGVKTGAKTFCYWQLANDKLSLTLDTRSGGIGVQLLSRKLEAAEIVAIKSKSDESAFQAAKRFTKLMCDSPRLPKQPVYGINDWYFSYGNNSSKLIINHTEMIAPLAEGLDNRPFSIIDSGWFEGPPDSPDDCCWGDMSKPDENFKDMHSLANNIKQISMRPGIWTRPLCARQSDPPNVLMPFVNGREKNRPILDPSIPENLEKVKNYFKLYNDWGYELVKVDYTSYDYFLRFGYDMIKSDSITSPGWSVYNVNKTNAEIIQDLYKVIREAAGNTYLIGCNTFSHLSAGIFELNRIGDDTSGNNWDRTRRMGINSLAFRGIQNDNFYSADADCVGLTTKIPWEKNKQWMELLAKSGTPLFISAQPEATGIEQKELIKECFKYAAQQLPLAEPLDWMDNSLPKKWKLNNEIINFNWD